MTEKPEPEPVLQAANALSDKYKVLLLYGHNYNYDSTIPFYMGMKDAVPLFPLCQPSRTSPCLTGQFLKAVPNPYYQGMNEPAACFHIKHDKQTPPIICLCHSRF
jgi:hypothetical protein